MIEYPPKSTEPVALKKLAHDDVANVVDKINDEYLYWSDAKYRANAVGLSPNELWGLVKYARQKTDIKVKGFDNLHFALTNAMQRSCHELDMEFGGFGGSAQMFPNDNTAREQYLLSTFMEEAIASSQMEGASTTREAAKEMLRKKIAPKDKSQRMIMNNYNTIKFIRDHAKEDLTPAAIMQIYTMMTENALDVADAAGRFRREDENIVVGNGITGETVHTPPPAECLNQFAENLCEFFNDKKPSVFIHPIIRGIIIHFLLGYYHPFADGNGRTARALFYWYMMRNDYWLVQYLSISRIIRGSKSAYEKAYLYTECDANDMGYFIWYNLGVLHKAFKQLKLYLDKKRDEKHKSQGLLHLGNITPRQAEILNRYIDSPRLVLTAADVVVGLGVTHKTAKSDLYHLAAQGYLSEVSLNKKTKGYIRSANFDALINP